MNRKYQPIRIHTITLAIPALLAGGCSEDEMAAHLDKRSQGDKPNVIFLLADDLGWPQSGAYGSNYYHTPNMDRLAEQGVRFTNAYTAAAICSPVRASIMTGKHPARLNITDFIPGNQRDNYLLSQPDWQKHLPLEEYTLGNLFQDQGYRTAMFGKWHLSPIKFGPESLPFYPDKQGFDEYFVIDKPSTQHNPELDPHSSDMIGDRAVEFIREHRDRPFFLFGSFSAIHDPLVEQADSIFMWMEKPASSEPENNPIIGAILSRLDRNIGKMMDVLDETGLADNTIFIFFSDNGGLAFNNVVYYFDDPELEMASQTPLRKGKGWLYEGGIRVPLIVRWPGAVDSGFTSDEVVTSNDFMPTFSELLGVEPKPDIDGTSMLTHLTDRVPLPERNHYWHYPHYHRGSGMLPGAALRSGNWKLIEWYEQSIGGADGVALELYNLENDLGETVNLAGMMDELAVELAADLQRWREHVDAQMPVINSNYANINRN